MKKLKARTSRLICLLVIAIWLLPLAGCWNYRSLSDMSIVAGMAVDFDKEKSVYVLTFEEINMSKPVKQQGLSSNLVESEGMTIFDAIRNAKKKVRNKLYFGHMKTVFIGEEIAKGGHITHLTDWFLRDGECRETLYLAISQEKSAGDILKSERTSEPILSFQIRDSLIDDAKITSSTHSHPLYEVYDIFNSNGKELSLPAIHLSDSKVEINGSAVFKGESLKGYLSPDESKLLLFALGEVKGGLLTVASTEGRKDDITLEISKNKTKRSFDYKDGKITIKIKTKTEVFLAETEEKVDCFDEDKINSIKAAAQKKIENGIGELVKKAQNEFQSDIFGFGNLIYKKSPKTWDKVSAKWDEQFKNLSVEVSSEVKIINTAMIKEFGKD